MDQSLHSYMRLGIVQGVAFPASGDDPEAFLDSVEQIAADDFFAASEIRRVPDDGLRQRVVEVLRASQLGVVYAAYPRLCPPDLDLSSLDDAVRSRAVEAAKRAIDEAIALGAERVTVVSGPDPGSEGRDGGTEALIDSLCALAAYSTARCGPPLALEPFPREGEGGHLIGPTVEAIGIVRLVREMFPDFGLVLDTGHLALLGEDVAAALAAAAPFLEQVHLANVVPGAGTALPAACTTCHASPTCSWPCSASASSAQAGALWSASAWPRRPVSALHGSSRAPSARSQRPGPAFDTPTAQACGIPASRYTGP
jgi:sugar phosphate isomerase/epimerase